MKSLKEYLPDKPAVSMGLEMKNGFNPMNYEDYGEYIGEMALALDDHFIESHMAPPVYQQLRNILNLIIINQGPEYEEKYYLEVHKDHVGAWKERKKNLEDKLQRLG